MLLSLMLKRYGQVGAYEMKANFNFTCPHCGTKLELGKKEAFFSHDTYTCPECHRTFTPKYNKLLLFAEIYILLKLLNMVSSFVVGKMSFVKDKEPIIFLVEIILALIISSFRQGVLQKLKIVKMVLVPKENSSAKDISNT